jgi:hypothetical protein
MLLTPERSITSDKLNFPVWDKPYGEALLETDHESLLKLLATAEEAISRRFLELGAGQDASVERRDIHHALDVMLTLEHRK